MNKVRFTEDYANSKKGDEIKSDNQLASKLVKLGVVEVVKEEDLRFSELLERLSAAEARIEALEKVQAEKPEETKAEPKVEEKPKEVKAAEKSDPSEEKNASDTNTAEAPKKPRTRKKQ